MLRRDFPLLDNDAWEQTSDADPSYNCAAFAARNVVSNWWPEPDMPEYFWPSPNRDGTLDAFREGYETLGFEVCDGSGHEPGFERIAIYATALGSPTHVARQLSDGRWTSKLGPLEDIVHRDPRSLAGGRYGDPVMFMKRPL